MAEPFQWELERGTCPPLFLSKKMGETDDLFTIFLREFSSLKLFEIIWKICLINDFNLQWTTKVFGQIEHANAKQSNTKFSEKMF